jgi:glutathione-independent formaldehyde dehydrogenase
VLVSITSTNICGSDLHIYEGRAPLDPANAIGRENLGQVIPTRDAVVKVRVGDMVSVPFNIAYGFCANCERKLTGFCTIGDSPCPSTPRLAATRS